MEHMGRLTRDQVNILVDATLDVDEGCDAVTCLPSVKLFEALYKAFPGYPWEGLHYRREASRLQAQGVQPPEWMAGYEEVEADGTPSAPQFGGVPLNYELMDGDDDERDQWPTLWKQLHADDE